jgi:NADH pyrophosphatase NudC (nudix superfamily)
MKLPKFCPSCASELESRFLKDRDRLVCSADCGYVHWNNPTPVIAAIVEAGNDIVLVRSIGWPEGWFGLVTGFLEEGEDTIEGVKREVVEETGLEPIEVNFVGIYPFFKMNQLLITYHVKVKDGDVKIDASELAEYKRVPIDKVKPWNSGTGYALNDWLKSKGIEAEFVRFGSKK